MIVAARMASRFVCSAVCRVFDHDWKTIAVNEHRVMALGHLSRLAGAYSECRRCGHCFNDLGDEHEHLEFVALVQQRVTFVQPLAFARVHGHWWSRLRARLRRRRVRPVVVERNWPEMLASGLPGPGERQSR